MVFGLFLPFVGNYWPIQESMDQSLRNSLDLARSKSKEAFGISVQRLEDAGISTNQMIFSILLIVMGVTVYYGVPLSFINENFMSAFLILGVLLILVIIGLTFICSLLFNFFERALLAIVLYTCCRKDRRIHTIITKQMESH